MQHYIPKFVHAQRAAGENWLLASLASLGRREAIIINTATWSSRSFSHLWRLCYWRRYIHCDSVGVAHSGCHSTAYVYTSDTIYQELDHSLDSASPTIQVRNKGKQHKRHNRHIELFTHFTLCTLVQLQAFT